MVHFLLFFVVLSFTLITSAKTINLTFAESEEKFVQLERTNVNCEYPQAIQVSEKIAKVNFNRPSSESCAQNKIEFQRVIDQLKNTPSAEFKFPQYSKMFLEKLKIFESKKTQFTQPFHESVSRKILQGLTLDSWSYESEARQSLGVIGEIGNRLPGNSSTESCLLNKTGLFLDISSKPYDFKIWHQVLMNEGYECMVQIYRQFSQNQNKSFGKADSQNRFETALESNLQGLRAEAIKDQIFIYFPNLSYDFPQLPWQKPRENLSPTEMKSAFEAMGAQFYVADRVTIAHRDDQVRQAKDAVTKIFSRLPAHSANKKVIFLGRSMGAMVAREVLQQFPEIKSRVKAVVNVGGTPFGSVIADYKSRADVFDFAYAETNAFLGNIVGLVWPKIIQAAKFRQNFESMSHFSFQGQLLEENFPILNVIFLPSRLTQYFGGSERIPVVDQTFLFMAMYGPTEGSAPLATASWDSKRSARVFYDRTNHLTFWELDDSKSLALWSAAIETAFHLGLLND